MLRRVNIGYMADAPQLSEVAYFAQNLTTIEVVWLLGWNIADGRLGRIGLDEAAGRDLLVDLFRKLHGGLDVVKQSGGRLQQRLMSLRQGTFEEIQQQAPFSSHARRDWKPSCGRGKTTDGRDSRKP